MNEFLIDSTGTYSHADRPGTLHDPFTIDWGAFVRFRGTINEVREQAFWKGNDLNELSEGEKKLLVPVDDQRSIRRITFDCDSISVTGDRFDRRNTSSPKAGSRENPRSLFD